MQTRPQLALSSLMISASVLAGGCPSITPPGDNQSAVNAVISISATSGSPPLTVAFSGDASTSENGGELKYRWTINGVLFSEAASGATTFTAPGRYVIALRVTDSVGEEDTATQTMRIRGVGATAVISASTTSGPVPLVVDFDGTGSSAPDDVILDYFWDFGDGSDGSRDPAPRHTFTPAGDYTVTLRVVTAGGVEATAQTTIQAGTRIGSLQFNGSQFATLPLASSQSMPDFTFETWVNSDPDGGTVASLGEGAVTLELIPSTNTIRVQIGDITRDATASSLSGAWRHLAISHSATAGATLYLDGAPLTNVTNVAAVTIGGTILGNGFRGRAGEVRFWSVARSASEILAARDRRLSTATTGLLGAWPLFEGSGQTLDNRAGSPDGTRGSSTAAESSDPAWSSDGPPI